MKLYANWRTIIKKAWSMRLMALAIVLTVAEAILPLFETAISRGVFAALTAVTIAGAMIARIVAQADV